MPKKLTIIGELNRYPGKQTPWIFWLWLKENNRTISHPKFYRWEAFCPDQGNYTAASAGELAAKLLTAMGYEHP